MEKSEKGLSAGRVQSVAVKLIIDRENEIKNFQPEEYWTITGQFEKDGESFTANFYGVNNEKKELKSETDVKEILSQLENENFTIQKVVKRKKTESITTVHNIILTTRSC